MRAGTRPARLVSFIYCFIKKLMSYTSFFHLIHHASTLSIDPKTHLSFRFLLALPTGSYSSSSPSPSPCWRRLRLEDPTDVVASPLSSTVVKAFHRFSPGDRSLGESAELPAFVVEGYTRLWASPLCCGQPNKRSYLCRH